MVDSASDSIDWSAVTARALAYLCLQASDQRDAKVLDQADFLARFGIPRREAATILGTTDDSLRVLEGRRRKAESTSKTRKASKRTSKS